MASDVGQRRGALTEEMLAVQLRSLSLGDTSQAAAEEHAVETNLRLRRGKLVAHNDPHVQRIPDGLYRGRPGAVRKIRITNCALRFIQGENPNIDAPLTLSFFYNLKVLDVSRNKLTVLTADIGNLPLLKILNISGNVITHLPDSIGDCRTLVELRADNNLLSGSLPDSLHELRHLKVLHIDNNDLTPGDIPDGAGSQLALKNLRVDEAVVSSGVPPFPLKEVSGFRSLISSNGTMTVLPTSDRIPTARRRQQNSSFDMVPAKLGKSTVRFAPDVTIKYEWETVVDGEQLAYDEEFKVRPLEMVITSVEHLSKLRAEFLNRVSQVIIEGDRSASKILPMLSSLQQVRTIVLKNCNLEVLPEDLFTLPNLRYVDVSGNSIKELPDFSNSVTLRTLIASGNKLTEFPELSQNLMKLDLSGNFIFADIVEPGEENAILERHFAKATEALIWVNLSDNTIIGRDWRYVPDHIKLKFFKVDSKAADGADLSPMMLAGKSPVLQGRVTEGWARRVLDTRILRQYRGSEVGRLRFQGIN
ncbi:MAG: hypothetical protein S4CHLAM37_07150 [Chlamydiia bacterium]|nr:hypothetical protein [Chlamydiia bacterium]